MARSLAHDKETRFGIALSGNRFCPAFGQRTQLTDTHLLSYCCQHAI
jgi:hypothetical protein